MTTPIVLLDALGLEQLPESLQLHMVATRNFFKATQIHSSCLKKGNSSNKIVDFDEFSSKFYKKHKKCAPACVCDDKN